MNLGPIRYFTQPTDRMSGGIFFRGLLRDNPGIPSHLPRTLDCHALVFVFAGLGRYEDEKGFRCECQPGSLLFLFPGLAHAYGGQPGEGWSELFFMIRSPLFAELERQGVIQRDEPHWQLQPADYWARRFHTILEEAPLPGETSGLEELGRLMQLIGEAGNSSRATRGKSPRQWISRARVLLEDPELALEEVARELGVSYESFRKQFKSQTGHSPKQFRDRQRIDHSCRLLHNTEWPIKVISDRMGFCDPFHFSKQFKRYTGMSPREFRHLV